MASAVSTCKEPFVIGHAPVQVFVIQYGFEPAGSWDEDSRLTEAARRISYLAQLESLANGSYGPFAVTQLHEDEPGSCRANAIEERLIQNGLAPGQAVVLIWGRIYVEGDDVIVQSYLRFARVDPEERRFIEERFSVDLIEPTQRLEGSLPVQSVAFTPRRLSAKALDRIYVDWRASARLHEEPRAEAESGQLPSPEAAVASYVRERTADGWIGIELPQLNKSGWLAAGPLIGKEFRELLSELDFVDGVIGYLSYRQSSEDRNVSSPAAPWMLERIQERFTSFARAEVNPSSDASVLASTLIGTLKAFEAEGQTVEGIELLRQAVRQRVDDGDLRNLLAMALLKQCCASGGSDPALEQVSNMLLAGLAVQPNNADLLANLESTYAWLTGEAGVIAADVLSTITGHSDEAIVALLAAVKSDSAARRALGHLAARNSRHNLDSVVVVVQRGDSLWRIAERLYGDGTRYAQIHQANWAQIDDPGKIYPGQILRAPAPGRKEAATVSASSVAALLGDLDHVVVQPGDTLWRIAERLYGDGMRYVRIHEANRAQIDDPSKIYPGQILRVPPPDLYAMLMAKPREPAAAVSAPADVYAMLTVPGWLRDMDMKRAAVESLTLANRAASSGLSIGEAYERLQEVRKLREALGQAD